MIPATSDPTVWPQTIDEQQHWHRSEYVDRPPPISNLEDRRAPTGSNHFPPVGFSQGSAPTFAQERPTDGYFHRTRGREHQHSLDGRFSQPDFVQIAQSSGNFFDAPPLRTPPRFNNFSHDFRYCSAPLPYRRPAHWEDNSYQGNPWFDTLPRPYLNGYPNECCPVDHHYQHHANHCRHSHVGPQAVNQQSCAHHSSCHPPSRFSTLAYIGPCHGLGCTTSQTCAASIPPKSSDTAGKNNRDDDQLKCADSKYTSEEEKRFSKMKRWLNKYLALTLKFPKTSHNETLKSTETKQPNIKVSSTPRRESHSSISSDTQVISPTSDTIPSSTSIPRPQDPSQSSDNRQDHTSQGNSSWVPPAPDQMTLRPPSTISTCQCIPTSINLHPILRHNPFDKSAIYWNVTLSPALIYEPDLKSDFLKDFATNPPTRHIFINGLGDFPLEKCQGDPDPSRSKTNRQQHMYPTGEGDELIEKRTLPWPIRITGTGINGFITLEDIFRAIYLNFQEYVPYEEYDFYTIRRKRLITAAYHLRQKALEETRSWPQGPVPEGYVRPVFAEDQIEDGIMRCDYLGSQLMFRGLEISPDKEGYTLFLGPTD